MKPIRKYTRREIAENSTWRKNKPRSPYKPFIYHAEGLFYDCSKRGHNWALDMVFGTDRRQVHCRECFCLRTSYGLDGRTYNVIRHQYGKIKDRTWWSE